MSKTPQVAEVASLVVAALNANPREFSLGFTAVRVSRPLVDLKSLGSAVQVTVVPSAREWARITRRDFQYDVSVDIGIQAKVDPDNVSVCDAMYRLVEEIGERLGAVTLEADNSLWTAIEFDNSEVVSQDHLENYRLFTSVLTVKYRRAG